MENSIITKTCSRCSKEKRKYDHLIKHKPKNIPINKSIIKRFLHNIL